jgi:pantetheine-phosphate adenylyltransferase
VVIAVAPSKKKSPLFTTEERIQLIKDSIKDFMGASVESFDNLLVSYAKEKGSVAIIRGLRAISDYEYELQMALTNRRLDSSVETVFMMPSEEHTFISSSIVKEVASFGGPVTGLVPEAVEKALKEKFKE